MEKKTITIDFWADVFNQQNIDRVLAEMHVTGDRGTVDILLKNVSTMCVPSMIVRYGQATTDHLQSQIEALQQELIAMRAEMRCRLGDEPSYERCATQFISPPPAGYALIPGSSAVFGPKTATAVASEQESERDGIAEGFENSHNYNIGVAVIKLAQLGFSLQTAPEGFLKIQIPDYGMYVCNIIGADRLISYCERYNRSGDNLSYSEIDAVINGRACQLLAMAHDNKKPQSDIDADRKRLIELECELKMLGFDVIEADGEFMIRHGEQKGEPCGPCRVNVPAAEMLIGHCEARKKMASEIDRDEFLYACFALYRLV